MKTSRQFLLFVTLTLLLFGLAAHSLPAASLCECFSTQRSGTRATSFDLCLVCQLQMGIHASTHSTNPNRETAFHVGDQPAMIHLKRVFPVLHPPTA